MQAKWRLLVIVLITLNAIPEVVLQLADAGLIGTVRWRFAAYSYGALWKGLLVNWQPNFTGQPVLMFVTYGFLHGGAMHLIGNLLGLAWLIPITAQQVGTRGLLLVYAAALLGGGLGFVLLSDSVRPMVGASGAVYGLAAAWAYWDYCDRKMQSLPLGPAWIKLGVILSTNILSWWLLSGEIAWQTHIGGMIAAICCAWVLKKPPECAPVDQD
jgi:membrane associated rhomboid family serine protease